MREVTRLTGKRLKAGQKAPASGRYQQIGPKGGKGRKVTVVKGAPLPPTAKSGMVYKLVNVPEDAPQRRTEGALRGTRVGKKVVYVRKRGQVTIPKPVANRLNLGEGSHLLLEVHGDAITLRPARVVPLAGSLEARVAEEVAEEQIAPAGAPRFRRRRELGQALEKLRPEE